MINIWLDVELDGFGGKLLSIGMVSADGKYFYEVVDTPAENAFAKEHVAPHLAEHLTTSPQSLESIKVRLTKYLGQFDAVNVIADWPFDLEHFFSLLYTPDGRAYTLPEITTHLKMHLNGVGASPIHHALIDAIALRDADLSRDKQDSRRGSWTRT